MKDEMLASAREGFAAWQAGDFATLEALLDPGVQWRWFEPGDWDCRDRKDVMARLRERFEEASSVGRWSSSMGARIQSSSWPTPARLAATNGRPRRRR